MLFFKIIEWLNRQEKVLLSLRRQYYRSHYIISSRLPEIDTIYEQTKTEQKNNEEVDGQEVLCVHVHVIPKESRWEEN